MGSVLRRYLILIILFSLLVTGSEAYPGVYINEIMAVNVLSYPNPEGEYEDWIELYNSGDQALDLAGYYLANGASTKWQIPYGNSSKSTIPAKGFLVFSADGRTDLAFHVSFSLGKEGEDLFLLDKDGSTLIDYIHFPEQLRDISYGRWQDGGTVWNYMHVFSPGTVNKPGYNDFSNRASIVLNSGFYNNSVTVYMSNGHPYEIIRYTTDGSDPGESSAQYTGPLEISTTCVLRARTFRNGYLPGEIISKSVFINENQALPVLSLITDPKNLYDPATGIYVHDFDGRAWERYSEFEYFDENKLAFKILAGIRIQGNTGPMDFNKKSFRLFLRKGYGADELTYPLFIHDRDHFNTKLVLRSGYDDDLETTSAGSTTTGTLIRDPLITELWRQTGSLVSNSKLSLLYINGGFHGIYDIKQSIDEDFIKTRMGYNDVDIVRTRWDSTELVYGSKSKWNELISYFSANLFETDEMIVEASGQLDLDNWINLQAFAHLAQYSSWGYGIFIFRERTGGKWQSIIWDADRAFTDSGWNGFMQSLNPTGKWLDNTITRKLLKNPSFKNKFLNRTADLANTLFSEAHINGIIDSLAGVIRSSIPAECEKWNASADKWEENINALKSFAASRPEIVMYQFAAEFDLNGFSRLTIDTENKGAVRINTITPAGYPWTGKYFNGVPVSIKAEPSPGYVFEKWEDESLPRNDSMCIILSGDRIVKAIFRKLEASNIELIVPAAVPLNHDLPVIVRLRDSNWNIDPVHQSPVTLSAGVLQDTSIKIKRGAGSGLLRVRSAQGFTLKASSDIASTQKNVEILAVPDKYYSGTLAAGEIIWDNTAVRHITGNLIIPPGTTLRIKQGTWILIGKNTNVYAGGKVIIEGTKDDPAVITSETNEAWGGFEFTSGEADFRYCIITNGGGDPSKGNPTSEGWHTGKQHLFFGKANSLFNFDNCFFLYSPGKVFGAQDGRVNVSNSVTSFVWHGGEFHRVLLNYRDSHLMNLPNDDHIYTEDIDTDGFHIDWVNANYPQFSVIENCYFVTGKDDAIDHHSARLKIINCWLEDFIHEGVAASGADTVMIFNTVALNNDQGFEAGWTEGSVSRGPVVIIDHCSAVNNNAGLRIGDSYAWTYRCFMKVTNSVLYNNKDNIRNYLNSTNGPLEDAVDISFSMTNDEDYNSFPYCTTGTPAFDDLYFLSENSDGIRQGTRGTNIGRADSGAVNLGLIVINEIMYNSPGNMDTGDWIELYNPHRNSINISGWRIKDDNDGHLFTIPEGTIINPLSYVVICSDTGSFRQYHSGPLILGNTDFGLGASDQVRLFNAQGLIMDSVKYSDSNPWDNGADGTGYSLELSNPAKPHTQYSNWKRSYNYGGTPGMANQNAGTGIKDPAAVNSFNLYQNYPNPFNPVTRIRYEVPYTAGVLIKIYDITGSEVHTLVNEIKEPGVYEAVYEAGQTASGIYFYVLVIDNMVSAKKMLFMK